ncbi:MAG TPA: type II toxin-antitoxin system VapC family toxin [Longimicrobium sp.]
MRLLLDTHTILWFLEGNPRLSRTARDLIEDLANERRFSAAGAWEIAIKVSLGKLELHVPYEQLVPGQLLANGSRSCLSFQNTSRESSRFLSTIAIRSIGCSWRRRSWRKQFSSAPILSWMRTACAASGRW